MAGASPYNIPDKLQVLDSAAEWPLLSLCLLRLLAVRSTQSQSQGISLDRPGV